jgi:hypothetical protein
MPSAVAKKADAIAKPKPVVKQAETTPAVKPPAGATSKDTQPQ